MFTRIVQRSTDERYLIAKTGFFGHEYFDRDFGPKGTWWTKSYIRNATTFRTLEDALEALNKRKQKPVKPKYKTVYPKWMAYLFG